MKAFKFLLVTLVILANLCLATPSWAKPPRFTENPDYIEVTQALNTLLKAKDSPELANGVSPEEIQKKISELEFQKYALETGIDWGQCRNETGKTIAVYGPKPKKSRSTYDNAMYFLANGQNTQDEWDCEGIYLPSGINVAGLTSDGQTLTLETGVVGKIADGIQLIVKTNPETGAVELNIPPAKILKAGDINWFIPNISAEAIAARIPNVPTIEND